MDLIRAKKAAGFILCMLLLVSSPSAQHFKSLRSNLHKLLCTFLIQIRTPNLINDNGFDRVIAHVGEGTRSISSGAVLSRGSKHRKLAFTIDLKVFSSLLGWRQKANAGVRGRWELQAFTWDMMLGF